VAAYRYGMAGSGLPADSTLADATSGTGALLAQAGAAYTWSFALMSLVAAVLVTAAAVPAWRVLRPTPRAVDGGAPEPSDMVDARVPADAHAARVAAGAHLR
jgi:hypothetical protein